LGPGRQKPTSVRLECLPIVESASYSKDQMRFLQSAKNSICSNYL